MPCDKEHIRRHCIIASLEFHHRGDLPQPPSLVTTVLSRSTFDWTEVSLSPLPVIAFIEFAFQCLSLKNCKGVRSCSLSVPNSRRKVSDVLIFYFQRTMPALFLASIENRQKRNNPFHLFPHLKAKTHP